MKFVTFKNKKQYEGTVKTLPFNRAAKVRSDLIKSMNKNGFTTVINLIETDIITGKKELFCADGQHRALTACFLGIEFYAVIVPLEFTTKEQIVLFVASLNTNQKPWTVQNYVDAYAYLNYPDYLALNKVTSECPYSVSTVASMLYGFRTRGTGIASVKNGTFKCKLLQETKNTLDYVAELSKVGKLSARMVLSLHYVMSSISFNKEIFTKKYTKEYNCVKELKLDDYTDLFSSWMS